MRGATISVEPVEHRTITSALPRDVTVSITRHPGTIRVRPGTRTVIAVRDRHLLRRPTISTRQRPMRRPTIRVEAIKRSTIGGALPDYVTVSITRDPGAVGVRPGTRTIVAVRHRHLLRRPTISTRQRPMRRPTISIETIEHRTIGGRLTDHVTVSITRHPRTIRVRPGTRTIVAVRHRHLLRRTTISTRQRPMRRPTISIETIKRSTIGGALAGDITVSITRHTRTIGIRPSTRTITVVGDGHLLRSTTISVRQRAVRGATVGVEPVEHRTIGGALPRDITVSITRHPGSIRIRPGTRTVIAVRDRHLLRRPAVRTRQRAVRRPTIGIEPVEHRTIGGALPHHITVSITRHPGTIRIRPSTRTIIAVRHRHLLRRTTISVRQRAMRGATVGVETVEHRTITSALPHHITVSIARHPRTIGIRPRARTITAIGHRHLLRRTAVRTRQRAMRRPTVGVEPVEDRAVSGFLPDHVAVRRAAHRRPVGIGPGARSVGAVVDGDLARPGDHAVEGMAAGVEAVEDRAVAELLTHDGTVGAVFDDGAVGELLGGHRTLLPLNDWTASRAYERTGSRRQDIR